VIHTSVVIELASERNERNSPTNDLRLANLRIGIPSLSTSLGRGTSWDSEDDTPKSAKSTVPSSVDRFSQFQRSNLATSE
jgi:hypothetical protein